jgi:DNA-binding response OmpR family regulator
MSEISGAGVPAEKLVLIVDDDESLLEIMAHSIGKEGFRTETALDGLEGLDKARKLQPDVLVLDLMLPGLGGYEVVRELMASGHGGIPVIAISGRNWDPSSFAVMRLESGIKEILVKPIGPSLLNLTLHKVLGTTPPMPTVGLRGTIPVPPPSLN